MNSFLLKNLSRHQLQKLRDFKCKKLKLVRELKALIFLKTCIAKRVVPRFLQIRCKLQSFNTQPIKIAEKNILHRYLAKKKREVERIELDVYQFHQYLIKTHNSIVIDSFFEQLNNVIESEKLIISERHKRKISNLTLTYNNRFQLKKNVSVNNIEVEVINLTNSQIPSDVNEYLKLGPKTVEDIKYPSSIQYFAQVNNILSNVNQESQTLVKKKFIDFYQKQKIEYIKTANLNINNKANKAKNWLNENNYRVIQADKTPQMVVISKENYNEKFNQMIKKLNMQVINEDPTLKLIKEVNNLKKLKYLPEEIKKNTTVPYNARIPKLFVKIKIHKENTPMRPIVSKFCAPTFNLEKALAMHLKQLVNPYKHSIKNSAEFVQEILNINLNNFENPKMYTADVQNLYPSIDIMVAKRIIIKRYSQIVTPSNKVLKSIEKALDLVLKNNYSKHGKITYLQKTGAPLGSPLSEVLAEIILQTLENKIIEKYTQKNFIIYYKRYVDDVFIIWNSTHKNFEDFVNELNGFFSFIKFSSEGESRQHSISFLDVLIYRYKSQVQTTVFRKITYSPCFIPKTSFHPYRYKAAAIKTLIYRAFRVCSNKYFLTSEIKILKNQFYKMGYTIEEFFRIYKTVKDTLFPRTNLIPIQRNQVKKIYFPLQYYKSINNFLSKSIKGHMTNKHIEIIPIIKNSILNILTQDNNQHSENTAGVYFIPIKQQENLLFYFGQTARNLIIRKDEHEKNFNQFIKRGIPVNGSQLIYHFIENPEAKINFSDMNILISPRQASHLLFYESLILILYQNWSCNKPTYQIENSWKVFFENNRKTFIKSLGRLQEYIYKTQIADTDINALSSVSSDSFPIVNQVSPVSPLGGAENLHQAESTRRPLGSVAVTAGSRTPSTITDDGTEMEIVPKCILGE